jgi:ribosomal protein S18 acetylase RimI-like enzyme
VADSIITASTAAEFDAFGALIREYWGWLQDRYVADPGLIDTISSHQALDVELAELPARYGPPQGRTLLAMRDGMVSGGGAYHDLQDGSCEMKRVFVPARFQGQGTGRLLCEALVVAAAADGYASMRLDTGYRNTEAMAMYESLGFRFCPAYQEYPPELLPHLRFMERPLASAQPR